MEGWLLSCLCISLSLCTFRTIWQMFMSLWHIVVWYVDGSVLEDHTGFHLLIPWRWRQCVPSATLHIVNSEVYTVWILWVWRFLQKCNWGLRLSGVWCCIVPDIANDCSAFIVRVKQSTSPWRWRHTTFLQYIRNNVPYDTSSHPRKYWIATTVD